MRGLITLNKDRQSPCCQICVYFDSEQQLCNKKKKATEPFKKCRKFELDIMSVGVKRKRTVEKDINPDDFSIY